MATKMLEIVSVLDGNKIYIAIKSKKEGQRDVQLINEIHPLLEDNKSQRKAVGVSILINKVHQKY